MATLSSLDPWMLTLSAFVFGALIGSFLNVVIYRLPLMMERAWQAEIEASAHADDPNWEPAEQARFNLLTPRSRCSHCGHAITALENIPMISWAVLRGRCSACKTKISARYPLVEFLTALAFAACAWKFGASYQALAAMALVASLIALTGIDLDTQLLPDQITLPLMWLGLLVNVTGLFVSPQDAVFGAVAGYLILWSVYWLFKLLTGREGMGYGDFKLLAALGAWFGWQSLPMILLISSVVGAVIGIALILFRGKDRQTAIAFGPYLALGGVLTLFIGHLLRL